MILFPVVGQTPPFASVAAMIDSDSHVISKEQVYKEWNNHDSLFSINTVLFM